MLDIFLGNTAWWFQDHFAAIIACWRADNMGIPTQHQLTISLFHRWREARRKNGGGGANVIGRREDVWAGREDS